MNIKIYVCETQAECDANAETALCGNFAGPTVYAKIPHVVRCLDIRYGRFLRIHQAVPAGEILSLCEVQAFT